MELDFVELELELTGLEPAGLVELELELALLTDFGPPFGPPLVPLPDPFVELDVEF